MTGKLRYLMFLPANPWVTRADLVLMRFLRMAVALQTLKWIL